MSKRVDADEYEASLHAQLQSDLLGEELNLERVRLKRVEETGEQLRKRIRAQMERSSTGVHARRLQERLEEVLAEEQKIRDRIEALEKGEGPVVAAESVGKEPSLGPIADMAAGEVRSPAIFEPEKGTRSETEDDVGTEVIDDYEDDSYMSRLESSGVGDIETLLRPLGEQVYNVESLHLYSQFKIPVSIYNRLFEYQRTGVAWILKLYAQRVGGILGDEMGLGKTMQVIAAIATLQVSGLLTAPVLIVCPTTLIRQWLVEAYNWWPLLRVLILHSGLMANSKRSLKQFIKKAFTQCHLVITSYGHLQQYSDVLVEMCRWRAVFLDEGHKIRNLHTAISQTCKRLKTTHRYILSGTPIQNSLIELWSLMDFCFPGKLGSFTVFRDEFSLPISAGGYVNASSLQVQRAYTSACALRDLIEPYLLRRLKIDVAQQLPPKREQIVFCQLTEYQRTLYEAFLDSEEVHSILIGKRNVLYGIDVLRKICNHPDLLSESPWSMDIVAPQSTLAKSGKLQQVVAILEEWQRDGHRALLFCQTRQMLDLVESAVRLHFYSGFQSLRMDGATPVPQRASLVNRFNTIDSIFVFFLTTRVGGLGVNLTAADRVLIVDPDWNPSTDQQARERSWRLGQNRPVEIYRLVAEGTVEEKILHRQIFKTFLTHRILKDPKQTRFFKHSDLHDLFTLGPIRETINEEHIDIEEQPPKERLMRDIVELTGMQDVLEQSKSLRHYEYNREKSKQIVTDSVAMLQASGKSLRSEMGISDQQVKPDDLLAAVKNIASESDPKIVELARRLIKFVGGGASTDAIFAEFAPQDHQEALVLRQTLKAVARLNKPTHMWMLKLEFISD